MNQQYRHFRRRLVDLYQSINSFLDKEDVEKEHPQLFREALRIDQQDKQFIKTVMKLAAEKNINELEISSLIMTNRLFSQSCRLQVFALKDLLLQEKEISEFDRAMDMKEMLEEDKKEKEQGKVEMQSGNL